MADDHVLRLDLGKSTSTYAAPVLVVDLDEVTPKKSRAIRRAINDARDAVAKRIEEKSSRAKELSESIQEMKAAATPDSEMSNEQYEAEKELDELSDYDAYEDLTFNCLVAVADQFDQAKKVSRDTFDATSNKKTKKVLFDILTEANAAAASLFRSE